jgi:hypothetical protein
VENKIDNADRARLGLTPHLRLWYQLLKIRGLLFFELARVQHHQLPLGHQKTSSNFARQQRRSLTLASGGVSLLTILALVILASLVDVDRKLERKDLFAGRRVVLDDRILVESIQATI